MTCKGQTGHMWILSVVLKHFFISLTVNVLQWILSQLAAGTLAASGNRLMVAVSMDIFNFPKSYHC